MMQNGISPATDGKLVLKNPDCWSLEASNFLKVASWATLKEIREVRSLYFKSLFILVNRSDLSVI